MNGIFKTFLSVLCDLQEK